MKAKLLQNIKMFIVGAILLIISFTYIKGHPGEWNSFVPSLQMLYYKGEVFFYKILGKDAKSLEIKQQFNKIYTELNYLVESSECADTELVDLIKKQQELLKNMDISTMQVEQYTAITTAQDLKKQIEEQCAFIPGSVNAISDTAENNTGDIQE